MTNEHSENTIRRLENGSIDHAYYLERGRIERSYEAFKLFILPSKLLQAIFQYVKEKSSTHSEIRQLHTFTRSNN